MTAQPTPASFPTPPAPAHIKLEPCPMCQRQAKLHGWLWHKPKPEAHPSFVQCTWCGLATKLHDNAEYAVNAWNKRRSAAA